MAEDTNSYSADGIRVLEFDDAVRERPSGYFGVAREDPELATRVLCAVVGHALHPAATIAPAHTPEVRAVISADLAFSVTDDQANPLDERGMPRLGYFDSLLGNDRWLSAAAAVLSSRATVEVWRDGRGFRQVLRALRPAGAPERFEAPAGSGTRVAFELDPAYVSPGSAITTDLASLDLHGPDCTEPGGSGYVTIRDLRAPDSPAESHHR